MSQDKVLIVGGGIGGLVLAQALRRAGVAVDLVEKSPELRSEGAGITLGANAMRVLDGLELGHAVRERGHRLRAAAITDQRGLPLSRANLDALEDRWGMSYAIHRQDLHEALATGLETPGPTGATVELRFNRTLTTLSQTADGAEVELTDGSSRRYRAVIGADGLHSNVRRLVFGETKPVYAGYTCWRWVGALPGGAPGAVEMWGRGRRVGLVPIGEHEVYGFFVANAAPMSSRLGDRLGAERLCSEFAEFGGDVPRVLEALLADRTPLLHHDIEEIELPSWTVGSVGLLGDAAHAMTPNFGQGAAMAIEDALVLARELVAHQDAKAALIAYEKRRRPRVAELQHGARRLGRVAQWQSPLAVGFRNLALRWAPASAAERQVERIISYVP